MATAMTWLPWIPALACAGLGLAGLVALNVRLGANLIEARAIIALANLGAYLLFDVLAAGLVVDGLYAVIFAVTAGISLYRVVDGWYLDAVVVGIVIGGGAFILFPDYALCSASRVWYTP